ncbi:Oleuropein beta-glucosidase [Sesamum angolense]|uniref:Oleuropein beta-glucosidase n=1 Tax=Sesamum angolense TaxID=2727404 RepID=A0AAE2BR65_9LAMI|nr:Oleuropein beta-glucosidase [Sesamum angolense]
MQAKTLSSATKIHEDGVGLTRSNFPHGFIFGTGTSAFQEDIKLMKNMGFDSIDFRFHGQEFCQLEYGGMLSEKVVDDFVEFAEICFQEFGDRVKFWTTINEPWTYAVRGYTPGDDFAHSNTADKERSSQEVPRRLNSHRLSTRIKRLDSTTQTTRDTWFPVNDPAKDAYIVARNLLLCHATAVQSYRKNFQVFQEGKIGIALNSCCHYPFQKLLGDHSVKRAYDFMIGWFLEPVIYGQFPQSMLDNAKANIVPFSDKETQLLKHSIDFWGLNYYTADFVANERDPPGVGYAADQHCIYSWVADNNECALSAKQACVDTIRAQYHQEHLAYLLKAMNELHIDVRGYFAWSYCDNFEWTDGYTARFGLIYIDYVNNLTRHMKNSALWFIKFLKGKRTMPLTLEKRQVEPDLERGSKKRRGT